MDHLGTYWTGDTGSRSNVKVTVWIKVTVWTMASETGLKTKIKVTVWVKVMTLK